MCIMDKKKLKTKGETMIERAENQFWAYKINNTDNQKDLVLLDNVQFIYELSLAELELKSFGVDFEVTNGLREFKILNKSEDIKKLIKKEAHILSLLMGNLLIIFI